MSVTYQQPVIEQNKVEEIDNADTLAEHYDALYNRTFFQSESYQRFTYIIRNFTKTKNDVILDLGCGPGYLIEYLGERDYAFLNGLDISSKMAKAASIRTPPATLIIGDGEHICYKDNSFDIIACSHTLHHYPSLQKIMSEINRGLKVGGYVVIQEPNVNLILEHYPWLYRFFSLISKIVKLFGVQEFEDLSHLETPHTSYHRSLTSDELLNTLIQNDFKVIWHRELYIISWALRNLQVKPLINLSLWLDKILSWFMKGGVFITIVGQKV